MYEVEVKVPADLGLVRERLAELEADQRGQTEQVDAYFDHPARSFEATDEAVRVRREDGRGVVTYKGPKVDAASKTRREVEVGVDDPEAAEAFLQAVGFALVEHVRKEREQYTLDEYTISLDTVDGLGEFVEVEAAGDESAIETLREGAFDVLAELGLDPADQQRAAYLELLCDARE